MANKEERILIRKISICNDARTKELDWQQCRCYVRQNGHFEYHPQSKDAIPCKEAIRRIARVYGCGYKAEVALNSLLGGKDGR